MFKVVHPSYRVSDDETWVETSLSQDTDTLGNRKTAVLIYLKHPLCIYLGFIRNVVILNQ